MPKKEEIFFNLRKFTSRRSADKLQTLHFAKVPVECGKIPEEQRIEFGITESLVRLSVGVGGVDDLRDDLETALAAISGVISCLLTLYLTPVIPSRVDGEGARNCNLHVLVGRRRHL